MRYIIVGGSAAAISAVESIRSLDHESRIDLFSDEETPLFSRVLLPYYVAEELSKPLLNFRTSDFFDEKMVTPHMGVKVTDVNPKDKTIKAADGKEYAFDKLLLATGGKAIVPPIPGIDKEGISTLKTMADAEKILNMKGKRAVVIGAGSIGVEACISLTRRGIKATLLEQLGQVMPTVFDAEAAAIVQQRIEDLGIEVITGEKALKFTGGKHVRSVVTDTRELPCDMVVLSVGVRPASELALQAGLTLGDMKGIRVDDCLMTSAQDIYAAGDVAETYDIARNTYFLNAIWPCAFEQGNIAGLNMAGQKTLYPGSYRRNSIGNFIGIPAISMGVTHSDACAIQSDEDEFREIRVRTKDSYKKLILKNGKIVGAILVGQTQKAGLMSILLRKQVYVADSIPMLMSDRLSFMDLLPILRRNADQFSEPEYKELMDTGL
ncbi:MAG: FAD-dependent oxidoreductase [Pseudomonadota bacterium]|nr:FAD-dependent oxidoreductase [Pseudomonadota bacterium]